MMKKYFLCLFFVVSVINVGETFALPQEHCPDVLLTVADKDHQRFRELSPEAQNMLQIASLIAQVTHSNNSIPVKVNIYHVLLAALTKIQSANEAIYRLNLEDLAGDGENKSALFVVLKNLGILRDFQRFLLEEIGLNSSNPEPFEFQSDGLLLLNLNEAVLTSIKIDYDEEFDRLWNLAIREKEEEIRNIHRQNGRILQLSNTENAVRYIKIRDKTKRYDKTFRIPTFPEHFFLASLHVDLPIFHFLSEYFDGKTPAQIKGTLYPLIDQAKRSFWNFSKKKKRNSYSKEQKAEGVALLIEKINKGIGITQAVVEIAEKIGIHASTLNNLFYEYKTEVIDLVINREQEIESEKAIAEVAEQKNIDPEILQDWIDKYKEPSKHTEKNIYTKKRKAETIDLMMEKINKGIRITQAIAEVAEQTKIPTSTLHNWFYKYKRESIALVMNREQKIGSEKAIAEVAVQKNIYPEILQDWVDKYKENKSKPKQNFYLKKRKAKAIALMMEKVNKGIRITQASAEIAEQTGIPAITLSNWFYEYKRESIDLVMNREQEIGSEKAIAEVAEEQNIDPEILQDWIDKYKEPSKHTEKNTYNKKRKTEAIASLIKRKKEIEGSFHKVIAEVAEQTGIPANTLWNWLKKYKKEVIALVMNREQEIESEKAILEVAEEQNIDPEILQDWIDK